jgi:hypothetical protein
MAFKPNELVKMSTSILSTLPPRTDRVSLFAVWPLLPCDPTSALISARTMGFETWDDVALSGCWILVGFGWQRGACGLLLECRVAVVASCS